MKTLKELDDVAFLRKCNEIRHTAAEVMAALNLNEIRKQLPRLTGSEPEAVRKAAYAAQGRRNLSAIIDRMLDEKPEETIKLARAMVVLEPGEAPPSGFEIITILLDVLGDQKVLDFFGRLLRSGLIDGAI